MKSKMIPIAISALCLLGSINLVHANGFGPQAPEGRFYPGPRHEMERHPAREWGRHEERGRFIVAAIPPIALHHHQALLEWIDMRPGMSIPEDAVIGGTQLDSSATSFVCRASYHGGLHPGKLVAGKCDITWGGKEIAIYRYQVLVSNTPLDWVGASDGDMPVNAIPGGFEQGRPLYICQAEYHDGLHPGKIVGRACNIGWGGREISVTDYNVLVN